MCTCSTTAILTGWSRYVPLCLAGWGRSSITRVLRAFGPLSALAGQWCTPRSSGGPDANGSTRSLVAAPLLISTQPGRYRSLLSAQFDRIVTGELRAPRVRLIPIHDVARAHHDLNTLRAGEKVVLAFER